MVYRLEIFNTDDTSWEIISLSQKARRFLLCDADRRVEANACHAEAKRLYETAPLLAWTHAIELRICGEFTKTDRAFDAATARFST